MAFDIMRGVNLGCWLSQSRKRGAERAAQMGRDDFARIRSWGFDHIRLPVDEVQLWERGAGIRSTVAWDLLDAALDWSAEAGLRTIVDLHITRDHSFAETVRPLFTDTDAPGRFALLWSELSRHLKGRPHDLVAYELLNEPVADDPDDWNRVYPPALAAIRKNEPTRTVVVGSNRWSQPGQFEHLAVPADDHLILTFHYYSPMHLTHYQAGYVAECAAYAGPVAYPGMPISQDSFNGLAPEIQGLVGKWNRWQDRNVVVGDLLWPRAVAAHTGLPIYCSEFGYNRKAPAELTRHWLIDTIDVFEEFDIPWALWCYGSWGPFAGKDLEPWFAEFLETLSAT
jgi:endoglucanase